jgi:multidrug resistance efflux pump
MKTSNTDSINLPSVIEPFEIVPVSAKLTAGIASLHVRDGDTVHKGQMLCTLDDSEIRRGIDAARMGLLQAEGTLNSALRGREIAARRREIGLAQARQDIETARRQDELQLQKAEDALQRAEGPAVGDARRALELLKVTQAAGAATRKRTLEQAELDAQAESVTAQSIEADRLAVRNAQAALLEAQKKLSDARVVAPIGGTVQVIARNRTSSMGAGGQSAQELGSGVRVYEGDPFLEIATTEQGCCRIDVDETDVAKLHVGMKAEVTGDAFAGIKLHGEVVTVGDSGRKVGEGVSVFPVTVLITSPLKGTRMGMTSDVAIDLRSKGAQQRGFHLDVKEVSHE